MMTVLDYNVLDHGFVRLHDSMGSDQRIVEAARVSYGQESKGEESDKKLIKYLWEHEHGTPFEHVVFTFHCKCPIFVMRQWIRHRMGSFNEISGRYTEFDENEFYVPKQWRGQDTKNKQGSVEDTKAIFNGAGYSHYSGYKDAIRKALDVYASMLEDGVAKEMARIVLPVSMFTSFYWSCNLRSLHNFLKLRLDSHAQWEIQEYARAIYKLAEPIVPWSFEYMGLKG